MLVVEYVMLQVSDVRKSYGSNEILRGVNLRVNEGERIAIMGPSGSGKSTLLNCIGGIDRPSSGSIIFDKLDISKLDEPKLCEVKKKKNKYYFSILPPTTNINSQRKYRISNVT
ncbi:MAG: ATP-binding cassette domain-containing protein [Verrucomicrobiales bacterium]